MIELNVTPLLAPSVVPLLPLPVFLRSCPETFPSLYYFDSAAIAKSVKFIECSDCSGGSRG